MTKVRPKVRISVKKLVDSNSAKWLVKLESIPDHSIGVNVSGIPVFLPGEFSRRWTASELCRHIARVYREDGYEVVLLIPKSGRP